MTDKKTLPQIAGVSTPQGELWRSVRTAVVQWLRNHEPSPLESSTEAAAACDRRMMDAYEAVALELGLSAKLVEEILSVEPPAKHWIELPTELPDLVRLAADRLLENPGRSGALYWRQAERMAYRASVSVNSGHAEAAVYAAVQAARLAIHAELVEGPIALWEELKARPSKNGAMNRGIPRPNAHDPFRKLVKVIMSSRKTNKQVLQILGDDVERRRLIENLDLTLEITGSLDAGNVLVVQPDYSDGKTWSRLQVQKLMSEIKIRFSA